eukprot:Opistho-2@9685
MANPGDYAELSAAASDVLDFETPAGLTLTFLKRITAHFHRSIKLAIPSPSKSIGFVFTSKPEDESAPEEETHEDALFEKMDVVADAKNFARDFKLASYLYEDGSLEALYEHRWSPRWRTRVSGISSFVPNTSHMNLMAHYDAPTWAGRLLFMTDETMIGFSGLKSIGKSGWAAGAEIVYTIKQEAPGISLGVRHTSRPNTFGRRNILTGTFSPISGHVTATYASAITEALSASTRYEYNVHSNESDFATGMCYDPPGPFVARARVDTAQGLAVLLEAHIGQVVVAVGAMCTFPPKVESSFGIEVQLHS